MIIKTISKYERKKALRLVLSVFMQYEAPDYTEQGINSIKDFIKNREAIARLSFYGAYDNKKMIGVIATRHNGNHIALLFVDGKYHRQGIGRKLFETIVSRSTGEKITVNSSPFAVGFYERLGFVADSEEQVIDGIRFTPMTYAK